MLLSLAPLFCFSIVMIFVAGTRPHNQNDQGRNWLPYIFPIALYLGGCYEYFRFKSSRKEIHTKKLNLKVLAFVYIFVFSLLNIYMMYLTYLRYYPVS